MRGKENNLSGRIAAPPALGKSQRTDTGNLTVNDRGELVNDDTLWLLAKDASQPGAELLSIGENMERSQPCRNIAQPNACQCPGYFVEVSFRADAINYRLIRIPALRVVVDAILAKDDLADGSLTGT